ncbi:hypothetical protein ACVWXL_001897 [Bradyrhizobium sp. GM22.5]
MFASDWFHRGSRCRRWEGRSASTLGFATAKGMQTLTGEQIRARFAGKQLTDEVHYRFVYDQDGTLRSYSMGERSI